MKFALVDNTKTEATKGVKGICPFCNSELIAKCGEVRVNHWSHKGDRNCDPWWEPETEWHRSWKNNFSKEWQEIILTDVTTGEKHIADVRTAHELVIEFQHSHIDPLERTKRENFYKKMIWVVDCTRLKRDYPRFLNGKEDFRRTNKQGIYWVNSPDECFPSAWLGSRVPVIFDFKGIEPINDPRDLRNLLYYLFPKVDGREAILAVVPREYLISSIITGKLFQQRPEKPRAVLGKAIEGNSVISERPSQYVYDRGKFVKRRRL